MAESHPEFMEAGDRKKKNPVQIFEVVLVEATPSGMGATSSNDCFLNIVECSKQWVLAKGVLAGCSTDSLLAHNSQDKKRTTASQGVKLSHAPALFIYGKMIRNVYENLKSLWAEATGKPCLN